MAEGVGLLNRSRASSPTVSSNLIPSANIPNCVTLIRHDLAKVATHAFVIDGGRVRPPRVYPNDL